MIAESNRVLFFFIGILLVLVFSAACGDGGGSGELSEDADALSAEQAEDVVSFDAEDSQEAGEAETGDFIEEYEQPLVCKNGSQPVGDYFVDVTGNVLPLDGVYGIRIGSADLDGDGWPDFYTILKDPLKKKSQFLYLNGESAGARIFADFSEESNVWANRAGGDEGRNAAFFNAADVNNDGLNDIFSGAYIPFSEGTYKDSGDRNEVLINKGGAIFELFPGSSLNVPAEKWTKNGGPSSLNDPVPWSTSAAAIFDYDNDSLPDIYIGNWYMAYGYALDSLNDRLFRGKGAGVFEDATQKSGLLLPFGMPYKDPPDGEKQYNHPKPTYGVAHCDINNDGLQDILVAAYGRQWNDLFLNNGDGTFANIGKASGLAGDDIIDYSDNQNYLCFCKSSPDKCPEGLKQPQIQCKSNMWNPAVDGHPFRLNGNTFGIYCSDFDNDGDIDLFLAETTHWWAGKSSDRSQILINGGEAGNYKFERPGLAAMGIERKYKETDWNEGDHHALWLDADNDGLDDLFVLASYYPGQHGYFFRQKADHTFEDATMISGLGLHDPNGAALLDYDLDGDVDILVSYLDANGWEKEHARLFENKAGEANNSVRVTLKGKGEAGYSGTNAIGARVVVKAGDTVMTKEIYGGQGGFGQQNEFPLTFGLGDYCAPLEITVRWPNSSKTGSVYHNVKPNAHVLIAEGDAGVEYLKFFE